MRGQSTDDTEDVDAPLIDAIRTVVRDELRENERAQHGSRRRRGGGRLRTLLVLAGVAALAYAMRNRSGSMGEMAGRASDTVQRTAGTKAQRTEQMSDEVADRVRETGRETSERAAEMTEEAADRIEETGSGAADRMEEGGGEVGDRMQEATEEGEEEQAE